MRFTEVIATVMLAYGTLVAAAPTKLYVKKDAMDHCVHKTMLGICLRFEDGYVSLLSAMFHTQRLTHVLRRIQASEGPLVVIV